MFDGKVFVKNILLFIVLAILPVLIVAEIGFTNINGVVFILFLFNAVFSIIGILLDNRIISMNKFFWYFQYLFMFLAPFCNYLSLYFPWDFFIDDTKIIQSLLIVAIWNIVYFFAYYSKSRLLDNYINKAFLTRYLVCDRECPKYFPKYIFWMSIFSFFILVELVGFTNLFFRSSNVVSLSDSTIAFIVRSFLKALPVIACMILIALNKNKYYQNYYMHIFILFIIAVCSNFPTSTSRYWMGSLLGGIILFAFCGKAYSRVIDYFILFGMTVVFQVFTFFKFNGIDDFLSGQYDYPGIIQNFNKVDFDAFTMIARILIYVEDYGIAYGNQLLNIIFFFVPRSIWVDKPLVTSIMVVTTQNQIFTNLSCPLPAEGFVNFGFLGVLIFAFLYAKFNRYFDNLYWKKADKYSVNIINIIYPILCLMSLTINRGPLQPSFVPLVAILLVVCFVFLFSKVKKDYIK